MTTFLFQHCDMIRACVYGSIPVVLMALFTNCNLVAYASIDWHDFVVVETVDYQPFEAGNFPPPTTPQEVGARVLLQDRILQGQVTEREPSAEEAFAAQDDTEVS